MKNPFCFFKNILGKPGSGIHSIRLFNIAVADVILTFLITLILSYGLNANFFLLLIVMFLIGILVHKLYCVNTTINKMIFGEV